MKKTITPGSLLGRLLLTSAIILGLAGVQVNAVSLQSDHDNYHAGAPIAFTFKAGLGNKKDWVGVYPEGVVPGSVGSTIWNYVDGTQNGNSGLKEGTITFPNGLSLAGVYDAHFLLNDGYTSLFTNTFSVTDPSAPLVHTAKRIYAPGEPITITFTNGPANAKDWIGIYKKGQTPGAADSTTYRYVDGATGGSAALSDGSVTFSAGLPSEGNYVAFLLENDGYIVLSSESFAVQQPLQAVPYLIAISPSDASTNEPPTPGFTSTIQNGITLLAIPSVKLSLDGVPVTPLISSNSSKITVSFTSDTVLASGSQHAYSLIFADSANKKFTNNIAFTVLTYLDIQLPAPLFLETFDTTPEGELPTGWTQISFSEKQNENFDLGNLDSASYATWVVVDADRFKTNLVTYSDAPTDDYQRVLTPGKANIVNGQSVRDLATGRMLFADSGYRRGASQVLFTTTPDYNLTGKSNVFLSFHALYEQNQDSMGAVEYSVDGGTNWLPVVYYLAGADIVLNEAGAVDAEATLNAPQGDVAHYTDADGNDIGGTYGAFVSAPITADLAPHIQARIDDSPSDGKRVELFELPAAANQSKVRFKLTYSGTDSWYFGVDDFGIYSITNQTGPTAALSVAYQSGNLTISWPAGLTGYALESNSVVSGGTWSPVPNVTGNNTTVQADSSAKFFRLKKAQ